ncbi:NAD(P)H dehydrogenase [Chelonobacter oris]|uniref:NAD(P)H dehydrogenase n=1 Tax=Chelonobacter oris TaxID=505317 RepID=A0A0A3ANG8_9PAST|nr:NAD(P)H-dependent oxidoreductase [Chelonobacter oris]KGQ70891.1 NAD(P)H dehydrogenase [Chelonobacter oris]MDH2999368.1 NAD(P)H dehydrogenase [Chelonobacter oris]
MKNILVISGHPNLAQSVANRTILEKLAQALPNAEIRKLDELYPNYHIDVAAEQTALEKADLIVWQFPFYWYSMPALMKKWLDDVFVHGFAHGSSAKLGGKQLLVSITTGAPKGAYAKDAFMRHDVEDYFAALESTAVLCNLDLVSPMYLNGVSYVGRDQAAVAQQQAEAGAYADRLIAQINSL